MSTSLYQLYMRHTISVVASPLNEETTVYFLLESAVCYIYIYCQREERGTFSLMVAGIARRDAVINSI